MNEVLESSVRYDLVYAAVEEVFGWKRCPEFKNDCPSCLAWAELVEYQNAVFVLADAKQEKQWIIEERDRTFALMLDRAEKAEAENTKLRTALWDIHAYCNNWDFFIWMWPISRIKRFVLAALASEKEGK